MNLRQLNEPTEESTHGDERFSKFSIPNFRVADSIVGNIGEPLDHSQERTDYDFTTEDETSHWELSPIEQSSPIINASNSEINAENAEVSIPRALFTLLPAHIMFQGSSSYQARQTDGG